jgi:hypothetical protein
MPVEPLLCTYSPLCGNRGLSQFVEQRLGLLQIERVEAFGEPAVDRREERVGFAGPALVAHQPRIARRSAELPGFRLLLPGPVERGDVAALRTCRVAFAGAERALNAQGFGIVITLFPARPLDLGKDLVDQSECAIDIAELRRAFCENRF